VIYRVTKSAFGDLAAGDARPDGGGAAGQVNLSSVGAHGLVLWTPRRGLSLTAGARYDHHNIYGGRPSARLGGVVTLSQAVHFKLLYGSAFKAPSPQLLYGSPITVGDISGNPTLKPSYVHTVEGQLVFRPSVYLVAMTGLAASYVLDQAEFAQVGLNQVAQNISEVQSLSWESELRLDYRRRIAAYANLSVNRTRRKLVDPGYVANLTDYTNIAYPTLVAHAGASALLPRLPLRLGVEASYVSARSSSSTNTLAVGRRYELAPYFVVGGSLRTSSLEILPGRETSLALIVRNVLDANLADPGFAGVDYPRLGRRVMAEITQQF
jgi:iron complex outermembrane receptor protein